MFKGSGTTGRIFSGALLTGILPIKKTGGQSAVSDFREYTMLRPGPFEKYIGFTEEDVKGLCEKYDMDFSEMKNWYDGYRLKTGISIYNSNSVMMAIDNGECDNYWMRTSTYESLAHFIAMDFEGISEDIIAMVGGEMKKVDTTGFTNDMYDLKSKDDVLTLLIHIGYPGYDIAKKSAYVPNEEIRHEYVVALRNNKRPELSKLIKTSDLLLEYVKREMADEVAAQIEAVHETGVVPLFYNDEQSLRYVIRFAFISSVDEYARIEELPSGHGLERFPTNTGVSGWNRPCQNCPREQVEDEARLAAVDGLADMVFLPRKDSDAPAMVVELKWNKQPEVAIAQIREKHYPKLLEDLHQEIILVGVSYDEKTKKHSCVLEKISL